MMNELLTKMCVNGIAVVFGTDYKKHTVTCIIRNEFSGEGKTAEAAFMVAYFAYCDRYHGVRNVIPYAGEGVA